MINEHQLIRHSKRLLTASKTKFIAKTQEILVAFICAELKLLLVTKKNSIVQSKTYKLMCLRKTFGNK